MNGILSVSWVSILILLLSPTTTLVEASPAKPCFTLCKNLVGECPESYQVDDPQNPCCKQCQAPNCGGFAGQQCPDNEECWYPVGVDAGYCLAKSTTPPIEPVSSSSNCLMCPFMMPECPECPTGESCDIVPQTCEQCSYAQCVKKECIVCIKSMPICPDCHTGESCVFTPQTCEACATATCQKEN